MKTTILNANLPAAAKMLAKFERKAVRYGIPFAYSIGDAYSITRKEMQEDRDWYPGGGSIGTKRASIISVRDIEVTGEKPVVGDYEFQASIEITAAGNFVDTAPEVTDLPNIYRHATGTCDHCKTNRRRRHIYVVRDRKTGTLVQVGRSCLRDFLGIDDPQTIIKRFRFFRELREFGEDEGWAGYGKTTYSNHAILAAGLAAIRIWGWTSKGAASVNPYLTATVSWYWLLENGVQGRDPEAKANRDKLMAESLPQDWDAAQIIIDWVRASEDASDYMHNLRIALADDTTYEHKRVGLVISAVDCYQRGGVRREKKEKAEAEALVNPSVHQGAIKERLRDIAVTCTGIRYMGDNGFGDSWLYKFSDEIGNLYAWFTGSEPDVAEGGAAVITGTVKAHKEFRGIAETQLTRVAFSAAPVVS